MIRITRNDAVELINKAGSTYQTLANGNGQFRLRGVDNWQVEVNLPHLANYFVSDDNTLILCRTIKGDQEVLIDLTHKIVIL